MATYEDLAELLFPDVTETIEDLEKKILETLEDNKCKEYDERDENYNYGIEVSICYVEDLFNELLKKIGG